MAIYKSKHASNYTVLPNEIFKIGLSFEAIGLLSYLLSLPSDWVVYKTQLHTNFDCGRDKMDRIFNELRDAGYILSVKKHDEYGKITYEHIVYDKPYNGEPFTDNPITAEPALQSTNIQSKEKQKKESIPNFDLDAFISWFNENCNNIPKIIKFNTKRKKMLEAFLKENSKKELNECCLKVFKSDFCNGKNDRGWKADIEFILNLNNAPKILEGKFDNNKPIEPRYAGNGIGGVFL
jgi:hypothetical protein